MKPRLSALPFCSAALGAALLFACGGLALREIITRNDTAQLSLPALIFGSRISGQGDLGAAVTQEFLAVYEGVFHGTLYYTPIESAFTAEGGFDVTPTTKPGLKDKRFPRDFLKAVELEGFGLMVKPANGLSYVCCCRGNWSYARVPLDSCGNALLPLSSTAIGADYELIRSSASFRVRAEGIPAKFANARWKVCDTGSGLKPHQIDFYWGEDAPMGPGPKLSRPRGMPHPIVSPTVLVLR